MLGPVKMGQPETSGEITEAVHTVASTFSSEVGALEEELSLVRMGGVDQVPLLEGFGVEEALGRISEVAQALAAVGSSVLEGVLREYVSRVDYDSIYRGIQRALQVGREARAAGAARGPEIEDSYFASHVEDLRELRDAAEQLVVVSESGNVPVYEPGEKYAGEATAILVAVGALTVGGLIFWAVSGG